ncbi:Phage integrase family protein [Sulfitobacter brevis]|uniref:Phage integrase family protein n=2 Tax=Sulfitobacter brevis TaxID=74348 RepID=A0A1I2FS18_9RHOB|nr:Phage integrase family protein [Sulfitobacter brevis]
MGLGAMPDVSLADARRSRAQWAAVLLNGLDPITGRQKIKDAEADAASQHDPTYAEMAEVTFEARKARLRNDGARLRWFSPILLHVIPKIGHIRVSALHQRDIHNALAPIWRTKHETADKALYRTKMVITHARLIGHDVDPFICDAARHMLGYHDHIETPIAATAWEDVPRLYEVLSRKPYPSHLALRWTILTATRGHSTRGAMFSEIDGDVWTVPAERMKGLKGRVQPFRVPLSDAAMDVLAECKANARGDYLFPSPRVKYVSVQALTKVLNNMGEAGRPHGFRTSFRTWVQDTNAATYDVTETSLAHIIGNKVERSYARSDLLDQRRILMQKWAGYVTNASGNVVKLRG